MKSVNSTQIALAAQHLHQGELVAFPTETVYGLGADARNPLAVAKIYQAKGRPVDHPVIVHLPVDSDPAYWARVWSESAQKLARAFWPGPLTMIVLRAAHIPDAVSVGQATIGLRCPAHPVAQALLKALNQLQDGHCGVAAPSANLFGQISPTTAEHVQHAFASTSLMILDGGDSDVGIESTIVDLSRGRPVLLRPGQISRQALADVLGEPVDLMQANDATAPRASGLLKAHYAPRTPLFFDEMSMLSKWLKTGEKVALIARAQEVANWRQYAHVVVIPAAEDPETYAKQLYRLLHELDEQGFVKILVEKIAETEAWAGVNDRLKRAAAAFQ